MLTASEIINANIEAARKRTTVQKLKSWTKTQARSAFGTTSTLSKSSTGGALVAKAIPALASTLLKSVPVVGTLVAKLSSVGIDVVMNKAQQYHVDTRSHSQMGKWAKAKVEVAEVGLFLQDIANAQLKDIIPKMNDAIYKAETARKTLSTKSSEVHKKLEPFYKGVGKKISHDDAFQQINELAFAYGHYLHRINRLRFYMDSVQAFMLQYEEGYGVFAEDMKQTQADVTNAIESYVSQVRNDML